VDREIRFHLALRAREFEEEGMTREAAERAAEAAFGDIAAVVEACARIREQRDRRRLRKARAGGFVRDVRHGMRALARTPGYTLVALLTLALGIGANGALFAIVRGVMLRPLALADPGRLVRITESNPVRGEGGWEVSLPTYEDIRASNRSFVGVAAFRRSFVRLRVAEDVIGASVAMFEPSMFGLLGARAALGRVFAAGDADDVVVLSHGFWLRTLGGARDAVGRTIDIAGRPATVIGVMPVDFAYPSEQVELWQPLPPAEPWMRNRAVHIFGVVARLAPGIDVEAATADLAHIQEAGQRADPGSDPGHRVDVVTLHETIVGDVRPLLSLLMAAVGVVLLIACANVAGLQLVRGTRRTSELAVRAALGGGRTGVVRPLLVESVLLAGAGCLLGFILARSGVRWFIAAVPGGLPRAVEVTTDGLVLAFMVGIALVAGVGAGILPALRAARVDIAATLRGGGNRATAAAGTVRARGVLVAAQAALSVVLLLAAGLTVRTLQRLASVDPGFRPDGLLTLRVALPPERYPDAAAAVAFFAALPERLERLPGVTAVSATNVLPISGGESHGGLTIEARPFEPGAAPTASYRRVLPNYFRTAGIPRVAGREFDARDRGQEPLVVIITETMARRFWPGGDAIGKRIKVGPAESEPWLTVVGVVGDVRNERLEELDEYATYEPHAQRPWSTMHVLVRAAGDPLALVDAVRAELRALDSSLLVHDIGTMRARMRTSLAPRRFTAVLFGGFGVTALALAALGVFGLTAFMVAERRRELGIRMALGADRPAVQRLVLGHALRLAGIGAVIGVVPALIVSRLMASLLWGVPPADPLSLVAAALALPAVAALAAYLPGRRAARLDPAVTLRE
jgi:putative ABC transport system permease protein